MTIDGGAEQRAPGLYIHVPFCSSICPYCDFAVTLGNARRHQRFVGALLAEIRQVEAFPAPCDTLYFGGGTPSRLNETQLGAIRSALDARAMVTRDCRVTLEANPEDVNEQSLEGWVSVGVDTLSLGVQSFDDEALDWLGRHHRAEDAALGVELARRAGIATVSLDLIYARPGQTAETWTRELSQAVAMEPDHISCYQLTIHDATRFGQRERRGETMQVPEAVQATLFRLTHEFLKQAGYDGYEVSNFARGAEHRSAHNQKYWDHTPYLGLGPSSHSFDGYRRFWNERSFFDWRKKVTAGVLPVAGEETLKDADLLLESLMLRLRTRDGLCLGSIRQRFDVDLMALNERLVADLENEGLVELDGDWLRPTLSGLAVADSLASAFELGMAAA